MSNAVSTLTDESMPVYGGAELKSIGAKERIQSIDVVRGFALIGIFFMNVEWFNRAFADYGSGIPKGLTGIDYWASFFVNYFVAGKFWTIFSLLFGMGFAVMLTRSESSGRAFIGPYIRRILALGAFGILHTLLLWPGDILYSYAFTAAGLMIVLFGRWWWLLASLAVLTGLVFIPGMESFGTVVSGIAYMGLIALYLRNENTVTCLGKPLPMFSALMAAVGVLVSSAALASFWVTDMQEARTPLCLAGFFLLLTAYLSARFRQPETARFARTGAYLYLLPFLAMLSYGLSQWNDPPRNIYDSPAAVTRAAEKARQEAALANASAAVKKAQEEKDAKARKAMDSEQKQREDDADRINSIAERFKDIEKEVAVLSKGSYLQTVQHRVEVFAKNPFEPASLMFVAIGMFLLGTWFVRSGIMSHDRDNLPLFRRIAMIGLPLGFALSMASAFLGVNHTPGQDGDHWLLANAVLELSALPASLAYVSIVILLFHSSSVFSRIRVLAPYGRMALTNYLMQSLLQAGFFYGWGLGHYGMPRSEQLVFAVVVIILQIGFSHWWLNRFAYGPMEWVWRAITYGKFPSFRVSRMSPV